ncbi:hypothetical protein E2C01_067236 [Portunus trituberculatus]|uniref:Uncharacterized protein n=1 Tax=Portunus trituberculatus TaxID=210409 RepID=A0A5B7HS34_PORTR|nr:hypothetical protein [Portunus trituberculatus]
MRGPGCGLAPRRRRAVRTRCHYCSSQINLGNLAGDPMPSLQGRPHEGSQVPHARAHARDAPTPQRPAAATH